MQERLRALLDAAQQKAGSDYKVAQLLGVPRQNVSDWRNGRRTCTPEDQALLAAIAGMDPEETLVRAVLEKHANTPKGEKLLSALGNASRRIGEVVTSVFFGSVGWALAGALLPNKAEAAQIAAGAMARAGTGSLAAEALVAIATMCIMLNGVSDRHQPGTTCAVRPQQDGCRNFQCLDAGFTRPEVIPGAGTCSAPRRSAWSSS